MAGGNIPGNTPDAFDAALALARDAGLGTEGTPVPVGDGKVSMSAAQAGIPCQCCFRVKLGGEEFLMVDYASAGKSWHRDSQMEVWMEC